MPSKATVKPYFEMVDEIYHKHRSVMRDWLAFLGSTFKADPESFATHKRSLNSYVLEKKHLETRRLSNVYKQQSFQIS